uniref:Trichohyalin-like n=1 Tax=Phascolarctos cinereus TaxID=38626 RepID=A0A6P5J8Z8_PHACI|nr:trichohyalin-like [Phascolarctos cinereus]XP_020830594.1 trichohyalin-like [Phascolarctos cinereus]XP_020830595.1 trichohyalin-like [Phascolarctos cinereus]XP_020830596.1 trichohyalin-like [Phascolarctos cinereus]XP_020830597.1 trichohyalin-like [Phascolarctos cinereus]XP_020830598.1 trichohyalin-like [Phascolarctos cinereus]
MGMSQRTECRGNAVVDQGGNKQKQKQEKDKGRYREEGKRKYGKMWGTGDQEGLDKEVWGVRRNKDQRRDHAHEPSEEDWEKEHGTQRNRDEELSGKGWGRESREGPREEESQAQDGQTTLELKERDQKVSERQWKATMEDICGNVQELDGQEQDLRDQGKGKRGQNSQKWEAEYGDVKGQIEHKHSEGRQEEQPKGEEQEIECGRCKTRENVKNQKEDIGKSPEEEGGGALNVDNGMSDTKDAAESDWERPWEKGSERTNAKEDPKGKHWAKLHRGELEGEDWVKEDEESLKHLGGDRGKMKGKESGLEWEVTIEKHGESSLNIKYRKEEEIGNERGKERKEEMHRELEEDCQKIDNGEKLEFSAGQEEIFWGTEVQGQLERQESQESSEEEQKYRAREDGTAQRLEQDNRERVSAQDWEGDC